MPLADALDTPSLCPSLPSGTGWMDRFGLQWASSNLPLLRTADGSALPLFALHMVYSLGQFGRQAMPTMQDVWFLCRHLHTCWPCGSGQKGTTWTSVVLPTFFPDRTSPSGARLAGLVVGRDHLLFLSQAFPRPTACCVVLLFLVWDRDPHTDLSLLCCLAWLWQRVCAFCASSLPLPPLISFMRWTASFTCRPGHYLNLHLCLLASDKTDISQTKTLLHAGQFGGRHTHALCLWLVSLQDKHDVSV